jgi:Cu(I)/Ag(I) efflux system membrane fusion protein
MTLMNSRRLPLIATTLGAVTLLAFLFIQDARHGWPFSRHHGLTTTHAHSEMSGQPDDTATQPSRVGVTLGSEEFDRLGVQLEPARLENLNAAARYVATVTADESRISHVHTRVAGWVEELYVNTTGETVHAGQPLAAVFSQDLLASQTEYLVALRQSRATPSSAVLDAARTRLKVLGMNETEIAALEREGTPRKLVTVFAPRSGVVLRRGVTVGTAIDPSTDLMTIADLSRVWVIAEVPEGQAASVKVGTPATLSFPASGHNSFKASVEFIYPTLTERTRTVRVRFSVVNADGALRPGLYGTATSKAAERKVLTVARDAVVETGDSQHVFVRAPSGALEPRNVRLGVRLADRVEIIDGISAGEQVVSSGVFLIDSESRLRASGAGTAHSGHGGNRETQRDRSQDFDQSKPDDPKPAHESHNF